MNNLLKLISGEENERLEFKGSLRLKEEISQGVFAFSNASGGSILIGVSDDGKVIGVEIGRNILEELANYTKRNTDPAIFPSVKVLDAEGKKIIMIEVWNPGRLPDPLTLEDLKKRHKSIPRNPLIAKCFFLINSKFRIIYPEISDRTLRKDLEDIVKAGIMKPVGEKRGRKYVLK